MGRIMIFDKRISGHNLEYLHHIYTGALSRKDKKFLFVVPEAFTEQKGKFEWEKCENAEFHYLTKKDCVEGVGVANLYHDIVLLRKLIKQYDVERLVLINWLLTIIFYFLPHHIKVSGIMYYIYLYEWATLNWKDKVRRVFSTLQMVLCPQIKDIYVLNDEAAAKYFNKIYHSKKFTYLPDPLNMPPITPANQRKDLGIGMDKKLFLHFGSMTSRKGTLEIMRSITLLPSQERQKYHFVFAGVVDKSIKEEFYKYYNSVKNEGVITVFDYFCSYNQIVDLCYTTDVILIPYKATANSSGVVAYAAYFNKPVIGPSKGMIGKIIRKYQLGVGINKISADNLLLQYSKNLKIGEKVNRYIEENNIQNFNRVVLE